MMMYSRLVVNRGRRRGINGRLGIVGFGILVPCGPRRVPILLWVLGLLGILGCRVILLGVCGGVSLIDRVLGTCWRMVRGLMAGWVHGTGWTRLWVLIVTKT